MQRVIAALMVLSALISQSAMAKDLTNRLGVGYKNQFSFDLPSIAAQYYPNPDLGLAAALGIDTEKDHSKFGFLVKIHRIIFKEDNMNFFMGGSAALISLQTTNSTTAVVESESGYELGGHVGGEFFLPGLDSLGFNFEAGVGVVSLKSGVKFRTTADSPLRAGIIFYF